MDNFWLNYAEKISCKKNRRKTHIKLLQKEIATFLLFYAYCQFIQNRKTARNKRERKKTKKHCLNSHLYLPSLHINS